MPLSIGYPTQRHAIKLYAGLSPVEAARLAQHAKQLFGIDRHDDAGEICLCLAAFTDANFDGYLRRSVAQGVFSPSLAFHRAPADVRDDLLARAEPDTNHRDAILKALVWIGDAAVVSRFARWREAPPAWRVSLYIPPRDYAREARG